MKQIFSWLQKSLMLVAASGLLIFAGTPAAIAQGSGRGGGGGAGGAGADSAKDAVCEGVALTGTGCRGGRNQVDVNDAVATAINILSWIIGVIAVIMVIIGGIKFITSGGDSAGVSSAKNTVLFALIGLVVVALAQAIVRFVLNRFV